MFSDNVGALRSGEPHGNSRLTIGEFARRAQLSVKALRLYERLGVLVPGCLVTTLRLRELIDEYGRLCWLEGMTPQRRGQRFNEFIAELLRCWGVDRVDANVRGVGEIDVVFAVDGVRFILDAKWEQGAVSIDPIAKLLRRITQRLAGTRGAFLSMSGYTTDALDDLNRGQQPDTFLLDRTHLEAMLSGLYSPGDLFARLLDRASYHGEVYTPSRTSWCRTTGRCRRLWYSAHQLVRVSRSTSAYHPEHTLRLCCTVSRRGTRVVTVWPSLSTDGCC
jgi:hypothetical protein